MLDPDTGKEYESTKVKGINITHRARELVNFHELKKMVLNWVKGGDDYEEDVKEVKMKQIQRRRDWRLVTSETSKKYRITYDKRVVLDDCQTLPYGFPL